LVIDLRLIWNPLAGRADIAIVNGQPDMTEVLATWVIASLFTDRRSDPSDQLPPNVTDRRGWWGDSYADNAGDQFGSRLWLLTRARSDANLPMIARGYILESLQWLILDGIATSIDAQCAFNPGGQSRLDAFVTINRSNGDAVNLRFDNAWREVASA
jgi:phage gp46-like protein